MIYLREDISQKVCLLSKPIGNKKKGKYNMKRILSALLISLVATVASAGEVGDFVKNTAEKVKVGINKSKDIKEFTEYMNTAVVPEEIIDFTKLSQLTLGHQWRKLSDAEKAEFSKEYKDFLYGFYVKSMFKFKNSEIVYRREITTGESGKLKTEVYYKEEGESRNATIEYVLNKTPKGWRISDVVIEGITLSLSYKDVFSKMINEKGFPALIQELKTKNAIK